MGAEQVILNNIEELTIKLLDNSNNIELLIERAKLYLKLEKRNLALNDFRDVLKIDEDNVEANSYIMLVTSINDYFYNQTYNV